MSIWGRCLALIFFTLSHLAFGLNAHGQDEPPVLPTLEDFLGRADFYSPELSPSGKYLSGVRNIDGQSALITVPLQGDGAPSMSRMDNIVLNWVEWVSDERLLASITIYIDLRNGDLIKFEDFDNLSRRAYPVPLTRVASMRRDGSDLVFMFGDSRRMNRNFHLGRVVSFLPEQPDHILMTARRGGDLDLFKVNINDGTHERIGVGTPNTYAWYVDRKGEPAFRFNTNRRGTIIYIYAREDREDGKIKWRKTRTIRLKRDEGDNAATEFRLLFPGPTDTTYYVAARPEGQDKTGIYLYDFEDDEYLEATKTHPDVDVERAFWNRSTREIQGVAYYTDRLVLEMFDPQVQGHLNGLNTFFEGEVNIFPMRSSRDGKTWLLRTTGPTDSGSYYTYNTEEAFVRPIGSNKVDLVGKALGNVEVIDYVARDGLALSGYLTRPPLWKEGDPQPPLVMMPHGGPEMRDIITFNYDVQVLVAHGYQVFQPNFRGSSGFGKAFADKGRRQWGKAMQWDVEDGLAHLIERGLVEPGRSCVMGASYGGYSALVAATMTPELYECVIASSGPSDLIRFLRTERKEEGRDSEAYKYWAEHIGDPRANRDELRAISPVNFADQVTKPLLLIHPRDDRVVDYSESEKMAEALRKAGKPYTFLTLEESGHSYRSDKDERLEYEAVLAFLGKHLPLSSNSAPAAERPN